MSKIDSDQKSKLLNAIQLSVDKSIIKSNFTVVGDDCDEADFTLIFEGDKFSKKLRKLSKLFLAKDSKDHQYLYIDSYLRNENIDKLINFLMLTRLVEKNIESLAAKDKTYEEYARRVGVIDGFSEHSINSTQDCSQIIFEEVKRRHLTIRELSEKTGLTQTMLSQFKAGRDIRLSNLLKITKALNLDLKI